MGERVEVEETEGYEKGCDVEGPFGNASVTAKAREVRSSRSSSISSSSSCRGCLPPLGTAPGTEEQVFRCLRRRSLANRIGDRASAYKPFPTVLPCGRLTFVRTSCRSHRIQTDESQDLIARGRVSAQRSNSGRASPR